MDVVKIKEIYEKNKREVMRKAREANFEGGYMEVAIFEDETLKTYKHFTSAERSLYNVVPAYTFSVPSSRFLSYVDLDDIFYFSISQYEHDLALEEQMRKEAKGFEVKGKNGSKI